MAQFKTLPLAVATVCSALAIGYFMEQGSKETLVYEAGEPMVVRDINDTSSGGVTPKAPRGPVTIAAPSATPVVAEATEAPTAPPDVSAAPDCRVTAEATSEAGAMIAFSLKAPCFADESVTLHHHGLMFSGLTDENGELSVQIPAMAERALVVAAFDSGDGATAVVDVPALAFYDRVALQWQGKTGLQLHAREFGAAYFSEAHIWAEHQGSIARLSGGKGGFMIRLGDERLSDPLIAEIYTFPTGAATRDGTVSLTVETEVTDANCAGNLKAQSLERLSGDDLRARDLTLDMPGCDSAGDFLVLKNLVEDLKIAAK
ncbi:hypothetical protein GCM10011415_17370 [Salipiger pallidus]|uniref:Translocase n=1 Tax=Salipiger pallidus TaxID=1775170 RepID=A0A8J2ZJ14_9RHOB|nr:translocase [Salipiger pallidus]GGG70307.1 hypothetical protein GCM10011415_17370 [Salipiger pallidus]